MLFWIWANSTIVNGQKTRKKFQKKIFFSNAECVVSGHWNNEILLKMQILFCTMKNIQAWIIMLFSFFYHFLRFKNCNIKFGHCACHVIRNRLNILDWEDVSVLFNNFVWNPYFGLLVDCHHIVWNLENTIFAADLWYTF